jgi:hypothetical protein
MIVYRKPIYAYRSDSCPMGLGGYSHEGWAWRFYLPSHLQFRASNNLFEHIASIITPWIDIIANRLQPGDCSLSMTDSLTSEGWSHKTNFKEDKEELIRATVRLEVARHHAHRFTRKIQSKITVNGFQEEITMSQMLYPATMTETTRKSSMF